MYSFDTRGYAALHLNLTKIILVVSMSQPVVSFYHVPHENNKRWKQQLLLR